ncbi:MAG: ammonium transporter, partial [Spirochaetales bacterium]|nr:ammonium transporter [Spirochaetales bacterium]
MKKSKKIFIFTILALLLSVSVHADELTDTLDLYSAAFDAIWLLICGGLVFFMQAGFAMVETGLTRAKNAGNIIMKNLMDFSAGAIL